MKSSTGETPSDREAGDPPSFGGNVGRVLTGRGLSIVLRFASSVILARSLGAEGKGLFDVLMVVPSLVVTFGDLGISQAVTHALGSQKRTRAELVSSVTSLWLLTSTIGAVVAAAYFVAGSDYGWGLVALALMLIPAGLAQAYTRAILLGTREIERYNTVKWLPSLLIFLAFAAFALFDALTLRWAVATYALANPIVALFGAALVGRSYPLRPRFAPDILRAVLGAGIAYGLVQVVATLNYRVDILLLDRLGVASDVGQYTVGVTFAELVWQLPLAVSVVVFAYSANAEDSDAFSRKVGALLRLGLVAVVFGGAGLAAAVEVVIPLVFGPAFVPSVTMTQLLLPGIVAFSLYKVLMNDLLGRGRPLVSLWATVPALFLNVALNLMWIPSLGGRGAALASSVSYLAAAIVFLFVYAHAVQIPVTDLLRFRRSDLTPLRSAWRRIRGAM